MTTVPPPHATTHCPVPHLTLSAPETRLPFLSWAASTSSTMLLSHEHPIPKILVCPLPPSPVMALPGRALSASPQHPGPTACFHLFCRPHSILYQLALHTRVGHQTKTWKVSSSSQTWLGLRSICTHPVSPCWTGAAVTCPGRASAPFSPGGWGGHCTAPRPSERAPLLGLLSGRLARKGCKTETERLYLVQVGKHFSLWREKRFFNGAARP